MCSTVNNAAERTVWSGALATTDSFTAPGSASETQVSSLRGTSLPPIDLPSRRLRRRDWLSYYIGRGRFTRDHDTR